jgi:hypothetical protein
MDHFAVEQLGSVRQRALDGDLRFENADFKKHSQGLFRVRGKRHEQNLEFGRVGWFDERHVARESVGSPDVHCVSFLPLTPVCFQKKNARERTQISFELKKMGDKKRIFFSSYFLC